ncbi:MAG: hypothetical protein HYZ68_00915 [Chloroflexi bacterium]|nr:hypothetical protein [Chloroflexota bacterium]
MRVVIHHALVARRGRLARIGSLTGLALLLISIVSYWIFFSQLTDLPQAWLFGLYAVVILGFVLGSYGNRQMTYWALEPRADQTLARGLKGLDHRYHLYNYILPAKHLLLSPSGLTVLLPKGVDGRVSCVRDRWQRNFSLLRLLRGFGPEPLGNPTLDVQQQMGQLRRYLQQHLPEEEIELQGLIVFTHPQVILEVAGPSVPVLPLRGLKSHLRKLGKRENLSAATRQALQNLFDDAARAAKALEEKQAEE